jgi:TldD protein
MAQRVDEAFAALPLGKLAEAGLTRARRLGAARAAVRVERVRTVESVTHNGKPRAGRDETEVGLSVRVACGGGWGFAAAGTLTAESAVRTAERAVAVAGACAGLSGPFVDQVDEPVYRDVVWTSDCTINPVGVPEAERVAVLGDWSARLLGAPAVEQVLAKVVAMQENKFYADLAGTVITQQRVRIHPQVVISAARASLRTVGPPAARGWEYVSGEGWDWEQELAELPEQLAGKLNAAPVEPGEYDLVLDPSHLWLTIHESVGHATELDRALGHEISYAGTTFATPGRLGTLRFGSALMNVTADRTAPHALATVGFDDEGVAAQRWNLVEDGVLTGFQLDRRTAGAIGAPRSTGCAFAESAGHVPLSRMPNVSLRPVPGGPTTQELIAGVERGIYLAGSGSFSIDARRESFQFTAQRAHRIHRGRITGQVGGVAYQAGTTGFWGALDGLGGERTYQTFGADLCGKGQPVQIAAASHGCPSALFRRIRVVNP